MARTEHTDRLPPYSAEAEAGILGCALNDPNGVLPECVTRFGAAGAAVFYDLRHRRIYEALQGIAEGNKTPDVILLQNWLQERGQLEEVGGLGYIANLPDTVAGIGNLPAYTDLVWEKWLLRAAVKACAETVRRIYDEPDVPAGTVLDQMEAEVLAINQNRAGQGAEARHMLPLVRTTNELIETLHRGVGVVGGIRTYFGYLDKMTGGLHRKELCVLAARPSVGKTSLAMNIATAAAKRDQVPTAVFSMEMSAEDLTLRLRCAEAGVNFHQLRTGFPTDADLGKLGTSMGMVATLPIWIDDTSALGILELRARARRLARVHGCRLFVIDYLQLMRGLPKDYRGNREREIADISGGLKALAKELDAAVLVLSQLNRELERSKHRKPQLADLRESGAIEQDADLVAMLYRPKGDEDEDEDAEVQRVNLLIAKQRNGPTGDVELLFNRSLMKFEDAYGNRGARPVVTAPPRVVVAPAPAPLRQGEWPE